MDDELALTTGFSRAIANAFPSGKTFATAGTAASASSFLTSSRRSMHEPPGARLLPYEGIPQRQSSPSGV
ncbi:MAG: hypothetical protein U0V56_13820, partial [Actinomycetota bacterium]